MPQQSFYVIEYIVGIIQDGVVLAAPHVHNGDDLGAVGLRGGSELVVLF